MKITFIFPCMGRIPGRRYIRGWQMQPLPIAQIAGLTPSDIKIAFWDDRMEPIPFDEATDLVAMSVETYTAKRAYQISSEYRRRKIPVIMGGFHPTLVPEEAIQFADTIVIGEAEGTWHKVLEDFKNGKMKQVYYSDVRPDISDVMPKRSLFHGKDYLPVGLVEASRGCKFQCEFCSIQTFFNASQNWRDTMTIVEEIKQIKKNHKLLFFVDDNIVSDKENAKKLFEALIPLNVKWIGQSDITITYDNELLTLLNKSGCQGLLVGFESLNPENLTGMNKRFNLAHGGASEAIKRLHNHNIRLYATFVFGYDNDTIDSFQETIDFCIHHKIYMVAFNHLTPFPGTPLYQRLKDEGRLLYEKWWLDDRYRYGYLPFKSDLSPQLIRDECIKARKRFYSLNSIFKRMFNSTNISDIFMFRNYVFINLLCRREATEREDYPLGDLGYSNKLLKVTSDLSKFNIKPELQKDCVIHP